MLLQLRVNENTINQLNAIANTLNLNKAKTIKHLILNDYIDQLDVNNIQKNNVVGHVAEPHVNNNKLSR